MRLWHERIIQLLPKNQLLGQHRECCALRGNGWGKKHKIVDYVFLYSPYYLFSYHSLVMDEMEKRGYKVSAEWRHLKKLLSNLNTFKTVLLLPRLMAK